ncbi:MAG: AAA family ATPase [Betaproteobacteria bacterium]
MKLAELHLERYRKARDLHVDIPSLLVFIGPNGSGKSNVLDALRFLQSAANSEDFTAPISERGGFTNLAWEGENAHRIRIKLKFRDSEGTEFEWQIELRRAAVFDVSVAEDLHQITAIGPVQLLHKGSAADQWWYGRAEEGLGRREPLSLRPHECALSRANCSAS